MRRRLAATIALAVSLPSLAACGHHAATAGSKAGRHGAGRVASGSARPRPTYPLTGLPVHNAKNAKRPALSVKIDNISVALPQAGLNRADIVTEALVEGGLTRLLATFQSHDAPLVGPIRSARPVDADLLRELNGGIFAYSGADPREIAPVTAHSDAVQVSDDANSQPFSRDDARPAPDNLMSSTSRLYQAGYAIKKHIKAPPRLFTYSAAPAAGARKVHHVSLAFSSAASADWTYRDHGYQRTQDGATDRLVGGQVVTAKNVVILETKYYLTSIIDDAGNADPYDLVTGKGQCWVMRNGTMTSGTWRRPSYKRPVRLVGPHGKTIALAPGRTWIELLPPPESPHFS